MLKTTDLMGVKIAELYENEFYDYFKECLNGDSKLKVAKVNAEFMERVTGDPKYKNVLSGFLCIADGSGILWAAKYLSLPVTKIPLLGQFQAIWQMIYTGAALVFYPQYVRNPIPEVLPGQECFYLMLKAAEELGKSVYLFGSREKVLESSTGVIKEKFPKLKIAGSHDGYSDKGEEVIKDIQASGAELLFVALGSPEQEYWISDNLSKLPDVRVAVGEGGTLDFVSGAHRRAPKFANKLGLEWLWRLFANRSLTSKTGSRIKRVWKAVPVFVYKTVKWKIKNGN